MAEKLMNFARRLNAAILAATGVFAALNVFLVAVIVAQVALRRGLGGGFVALEELQWHLYAVAVMFGVVHLQAADKHVRVDALSRRFSRKTKRIIEVAGIVLLFIPFCAVVFLHGLDFVSDSWRVNERSDSPVGLPARWVIKSVIPATFGMMALAFAARAMREVAALLGAKDPDDETKAKQNKESDPANPAKQLGEETAS